MPPKKPIKAKKPVPSFRKEESSGKLSDQGAQEEGLDVTEIPLKALSAVLLNDEGDIIKQSEKWPLVIDESGNAATFLRYQNTNYLGALTPHDVEAECIRRAVLGALRYGKPLVLDMMEVDMFDTVSERMNEILPNLMTMIMDKSIMQEENYMKLVKPVDGPEYSEENAHYYRASEFRFFVLSKKESSLTDKLLRSMYIIRVQASV